MDLKPHTPLPPGMVPSASREDLSGIPEEEQDQCSKDIVREGNFSEGSGKTGISLTASEQRAPTPGTPPVVWKSPSDEQADLSGNDEDDSQVGTEKVPVFQSVSTPELGKAPRRTLWSPFSRSKDRAQDLREVVLSRGGENFSGTPKRPMKKNKIAPSPAKPQSSIELNSTLNFISETKDGQYGSSPTEVTILRKSSPIKDGQEESKEPPLTPTIIVKSKDQENLVIENSIEKLSAENKVQVNVEPVYSSVVKPKGKTTSDDVHEVSQLITELPKLETYEAEPVIDTSLVVENRSSHLDDHAYEMVDVPNLDAPDMPVYSAAVYKELKKHQDNGNVQLISVKGTVNHARNLPKYTSTDMSPLHYAAANGDKKELARLLSTLPVIQDPIEMVLGSEKMIRREGLEVLDSEGRSPIMHAVHNNHLHSIKMLAEVGANVDAIALDGSTCLHQAAYSGSIDTVALLLSLGADGLKRDNEGRTPLHWCTNNTVPEAIDLILDKVPGLSVDVRDGALMTPLMWAAFHGHQQHVIRLIERGADPQLTDIDGMTAAHWSVQRHDTCTLQMLISIESAGYRDNRGKTVMHQAAERGGPKAVSLIKAVKPTSVNDQDNDGRTPLHWATACENPDTIRALLTFGANASVQDNTGFTAMDYATQKGLHYCSLLLSQSEGFDDPDSYHLVPTFGTNTAAFGSRALQQRECQALINMENVENVLTKEQIKQVQTVCSGSWLNKFSNEGQGSTNPRYVWINPSNTKICWAKEKDSKLKDVKSDILVGVRSSASPVVFRRKDFDPMNKHKYSFTIFTASRVLDMVALSSNSYKDWLNGLWLVLELGSINTTRLLSIMQNSPGSGEPRPIP